MQEVKVVTSLAGLADFGLYFAVALGLTFGFMLVYTWVTPYQEILLIQRGNVAAAYSFGGALLGFAIPLASAISHSVGLLDMIVWGIIAIVVQVGTFLVVRRVFPTILADIPAGNFAKGLFLGVISLAVGILNAACMTY